MSNYKNVRLEEHVYQELQKRQLPRESMSQVVERLIINLDEVIESVRNIKLVGEEDKQ